MSDKTKAAMPGRQCGYACQREKITRLAAGGQRGSDSGVSAHCAKLRSRENQRVNGYQPFGSMPRCCNSFLMMRLIQAASESSPSCCCACSIFSLNSGSKRNWKGGLPRRSFLCVDTSITPDVLYECVMTHYTHEVEKATPRTVRAVSGRLTTTLSK